MLTYSFVQENGEWRISGGPDGIVLSQSSFSVVFTERALYFFDPTYTYLIPDVRWFASRATLPASSSNLPWRSTAWPSTSTET